MEAKTNYTLVGAMVLILFTGLIISILWLSVGFNQKSYTIYATHFHEAVAGLSEKAPVKFNGVQVGTVLQIKLSHNDPQKVIILLEIEEGTPITESTTATLVSQGITGTSYIGLSATSSKLAPLEKKADEPYPEIPTKPSLFHQLDVVVNDLSDNVNRVSNKIESVLDVENRKNLKKTLENLETFSTAMAKQSHEFSETIHNLSIVSKKLPKAIDDLKQDMLKFTSKATLATESISETMSSGKNALDKISQQTLPPAVQLLNKMNAIAANLEQVSSQLRQNPAVILRGTKPPVPGPGEK